MEMPDIQKILEECEFFKGLDRQQVGSIETREKVAAQIDKSRLRPDDFRMDRFANDVITVCSKLPIHIEEAIVAGSSLGATVLLEALKHQRIEPKGAFHIGPASEFRIPWSLAWMPYLFPSPAYHLVKYFIVWYFKRFRVNVEKEPEQMRRYENTILSAHPKRIKLSGRAFMRYQVWPDLETVLVPTRIAYASTDRLHASDTITRMAQTIEKADVLPCESNRYMHSAGIGEDLHRFILELEARPSLQTHPGVVWDPRAVDVRPRTMADMRNRGAALLPEGWVLELMSLAPEISFLGARVSHEMKCL